MSDLARRLTLSDAILLGLGSMVGAGVFVVWGPAAQAAGGWLLVGLAIAALVAFFNATASAQLAARYPTSGGTYVYGREELGPGWGFLAGWGFVLGKTASAAAMGLTVAAYLTPEGWSPQVFATVVVAVLAAVNYQGVSRTAAVTRIIAVIVLGILLALTVSNGIASTPPLDLPGNFPGVHGVLQSAGLLFFAFAGYARLATLGEEVIEPRRTIPRAILLALGIAVLLYAAVGASVLAVLGVDGVASSAAPLADAALAGPYPLLAWAARIGAGLAAGGALVGLLAGLSRTALAMGRNADLPRVLAEVHPANRTPYVADAVGAVAVCILIWLVDLRGALGFSGAGVLTYYFIANAAAFRQTEDRRYPRVFQVLGMILCAVLVLTLPWQAVIGAAAMFVLGLFYRALTRSRREAVAGSASAGTEPADEG